MTNIIKAAIAAVEKIGIEDISWARTANLVASVKLPIWWQDDMNAKSVDTGGMSSYLSGEGSQNIIKTNALNKLITGGKGAEDDVKTITEHEKLYFMGSEFLSTIYGHVHLIAHAGFSIYSKDAQVRLDNENWCKRYLFYQQKITDRVGRMVKIGQRSAGHPTVPSFPEWVRDTFLGQPTGLDEAWCKHEGVGLKQRWFYQTARVLATRRSFTGDPIGYNGLMNTLNIRRYKDGGVAAWLDRTTNGNTPPVLFGYSNANDKYDHFPVDGGFRVRQQSDHSACELIEPNVINYKSDKYGNGQYTLPMQIDEVERITIEQGMK